MKLLEFFRWTAALVMLLFGVLSHDPRSGTPWLVLSIFCRVARGSRLPRALARSGQGDFHHPAPP
ncbi:MAG: hypothetical protein GY937_16930 [bacterium]|nr:hypothetical protein [bacterium]